MNDDNLIGVLSVLYKWRKHILIIVGIATLGSAITSLLLPVYYKASTTFYPANPSLRSPIYLYGEATNILSPFGTEDDLDRLLSFAQSKELTDYVIQKFDLYKVYRIDSTAKRASYKIRKKLFKLYNAQKNEFGEIKIEVEDKDPKRAKAMADAILQRVDYLDQIAVKKNQTVVINTYRKELAEKEKLLQTIQDSIKTLRNQYGIYDIESQGEFMGKIIPNTEAELASNRARLKIYQAAGGPRDSIRNIKARIESAQNVLKIYTNPNSKFSVKRFNEGREAILYFETFLQKYYGEMTEQQELYRQYKSVNEANIPSIYVTSAAAVPVVKSYPIRSIIVIASTVIALIFSLMGILLLENYKDTKWSEITKG